MDFKTCIYPSGFRLRHIISMRDLTREDICHLLDAAQRAVAAPARSRLQGKLLGSCFFEPSTRTRLSFEAAMKRLGGDIIGFADGKGTSLSKRESLHDTIKVISQYVDALVIRHPWDGSARYASEIAGVPVINAGDGSNQHPTQTLLDLFSIRASQGRLDELHVAFCGDLKHARTIHSLVQACALFKMRLYFVPRPGLESASSVYDELKSKSVLFSIHPSLEAIIPKLDVVYMTRVQEERQTEFFRTPEDEYDLTLRMLEKCKPNLKIMHPLPRVREIDPQIDETPFAYYFTQSQNGLYVRQALLQLILEDKA